MNVDTTPRTLLVAGIIALLCSGIVSTAVYYLRPLQAGIELSERNRAILAASNRLPPGEPSERQIAAVFAQLDARVVDLELGQAVDTPNAYTFDHWLQSEQVDTAEAAAGVDTEQIRQAPVYITRRGGAIEEIVLPIDGRGMWSRIYGYLALKNDFNTIARVVFHRHGETPGIGDQIQDPRWQAAWEGKQLRDEEGVLRFRVVKNATGPYEVDVISGASVTMEATGDIVRDWVDDEGFGPFLKTLDTEGR